MAVLPALRWRAQLRLDPTCLVIGSMAPDFEYFVRGELVGRFGHTLVGVAGWGVPVTLILAALYHFVVKWPALVAAPAAFTRTFGRPWGASWSVPGIASLVISAAIGDLTHLLWDGVTHANGVIVRAIPALTTPYDVPVLGDMVLHRILQHTSTAIGLPVVVWFVVHRIRSQPAAAPIVIDRGRARLAFGACLSIGLGLMLYRLSLMHIRDPGSLIAGSISGLLAGTLLASVVARAGGRTLREAVEASRAR